MYGSRGTWAAHQPRIWEPLLVSRTDVAVNVLLYVAFGVLGALSLPHKQLVLRVMLLAILFSAVNEALQLYTVDRVASLTDIVSAATGSLFGAALGAALGAAGGRVR